MSNDRSTERHRFMHTAAHIQFGVIGYWLLEHQTAITVHNQFNHVACDLHIDGVRRYAFYVYKMIYNFTKIY